jgi:hypothetical protein
VGAFVLLRRIYFLGADRSGEDRTSTQAGARAAEGREGRSASGRWRADALPADFREPKECHRYL